MSNPIPDEKWPIVAAVLDAIDPRRTEDEVVDLVLQAVGLDAPYALMAATSLMRGMLSRMSNLDEVLAQLRQKVAANDD